MRIQLACSILVTFAAACVTTPPPGGAIDEGTSDNPEIVAVDSAFPPKSLSVKLDKDAYAVVMLIAPGHSATLLYPKDSTVDNKLAAGTHELAYTVPGILALSDSARLQRARAQRAAYDSVARSRPRSTGPGTPSLPPLNSETVTYLLVVTSPQPLVYRRVIDKTVGWSIPSEDIEALNAVAKQVKSTITGVSREWAAAYRVVKLVQVKN